MTFTETKKYLDTQSLAMALWWFIENVNDEALERSQIFFYLRDRVRNEA